MATLGHIAVGMAAGRLYVRPDDSRRRLLLAMVMLSFLSLAPDGDVVAFALDIPYAATWGHRGAAHSIAFASIIGLLIGWLSPMAGLPAWRSGIAAGLVFASHGLLDTLTDGGLGIALLWPLSNRRFFAPIQPLPVAPIGLGFVSMRGLAILFTEAIFFSPLLIVALWPRRRR